MGNNTHSTKLPFRMTIELTDRVTRLPLAEAPDGVLCRVWEARTPGRGVPCLVFVPFVSIHELLDSTELEAALQEVSPLQEGAPAETHTIEQVLLDHAREHVGFEALVIHRRRPRGGGSDG